MLALGTQVVYSVNLVIIGYYYSMISYCLLARLK